MVAMRAQNLANIKGRFENSRKTCKKNSHRGINVYINK
jgi:hypothetical protein